MSPNVKDDGETFISPLPPYVSAPILTKTFNKWKEDIPDLTDEDWEDCLGSYDTSNIISASNRLVQFKFLYAPQRLGAIYS